MYYRVIDYYQCKAKENYKSGGKPSSEKSEHNSATINKIKFHDEAPK